MGVGAAVAVVLFARHGARKDDLEVFLRGIEVDFRGSEVIGLLFARE